MNARAPTVNGCALQVDGRRVGAARRHQADGWFERPEAGERFRPPATKYPPHGCDLDIADEHERVADPELWQEECSKWRRSVRKRSQRIDGRRISRSSASRRFSSMDNDYRPRRGEPPVQTNRSTEEGRGARHQSQHSRQLRVNA
jgi:hypothetical protein